MKKKPRRKGISTASRKAKGRAFQQKIRDLFICYADNGKVTIGGDRDTDDIVSQFMGQSGEDVIFRGAAKELFPFYVECKAHKGGFNPHGFFEELQEKADKAGTSPLLFHKKDRGKPLVTMSVDTFETFLFLWVESEGKKKERK